MEASGKSFFESLNEEVTLAVIKDSADIEAAQQPEEISTEPLPTGAVFHTTNYDQFKTITANREVDNTHAHKLAAAIKVRNWLHIKPIDVTKDFEVIDGQHRLEAARLLGVPIYYRITEELKEEDIAILNANNKNWKGADYLNYWTVKGKAPYIELSRFIKHHPKFSLSTAQELVSGNDSNKHVDFRAGNFQGGYYLRAIEVAEFLEKILQITKFEYGYETRFVRAINHCVLYVEGFKQEVFLHKIALQPNSVVRCVNHKQYLEMLETLYNYKTNHENRIRFFK
ncbi:ParB/RepB/Spo0J family partition protein [Hymenobacter fodinae]|uniref:Uncharacterized protein n=1 Tax=Hymenobacter fodinae TaxID=2510796 RepID=A0A4Z0P9X1_9BACT|nr:ParB/RepB/Spo0J family partition protein [Hymenobacter fodinae]TGE08770.1 hypothetical protein EU556_13875 [Hymenobacter fodinae]